MVRLMMGKLDLERCVSGAIKRDFRKYITSLNIHFDYGYPYFNAALQFCLELERCMPHKGTCQPIKSDVIYYV